MATVTMGCINSQNLLGACDILAGRGPPLALSPRSRDSCQSCFCVSFPQPQITSLLAGDLAAPHSLGQMNIQKQPKSVFTSYNFRLPCSIEMRRHLLFAPFISQESEG